MKAHRRGILIILVTSLLLIAPSVLAAGKGKGKEQAAKGRTEGELPSGVEQYESKTGELPKGLEGQIEKKGSIPQGLETGGKKTSKQALKTKAKKKGKGKVEGKGPGF